VLQPDKRAEASQFENVALACNPRTSNSQFVDVPNEEGSRRLTYNDLDEECGSFVRHRGSCRVSHQSLDNH
jgi:hypothetical protein